MAAKKSPGTQVATWQEEMEREAVVAADAEANSGGGLPMFGTKSGQLTFGGAPVRDNQMGVIIMDTTFENVYYEGEYDPDNPQGPTCFAFSRKEDDLAPHKVVIIKQTDDERSEPGGKCNGCWANEWNTADKGRGKACKNTRRIGMIIAGQFENNKFVLNDDPEHYKTATAGFLRLPVTSVAGYSSFVKQVAEGLKRPPFGIVTKVKVIPDAKSQFKVVFEPIMEVPDELMESVMEKRKMIQAIIEQPYQPASGEQEAPAKKAPAKKAPAKKGKY
jgi:hypothetical protein